MQKIILAFFFILTCEGFAALSPSPSSSDVKPGVWNTSFLNVKEYSEENNTPMIVFMGSVHCDYCSELISKVFNNSQFKDWQKERQLAMAFEESEYKYSDSRFKNQSVFRWFKANGSVTSIPMVGVYWPKSDGTIVVRTFSGRIDEMPVKSGSFTERLIGSIEQVIGSYGKYDAGIFALSNTAGSRLEVVSGVAKWLDVPLKRLGVDNATNYFSVAYSDVDGNSRVEDSGIFWNVGETSRLVRVQFPIAPAGNVDLTIFDVASNCVDSCIAYSRTDVTPSISYPLFVGERTVDSLGWGEWTMDLDVAKAKVASAQGDAYTLVGVGGDLWCPDCHGIASSLYADKAFDDWAKSNKVALVTIDQPRYGTKTASMLSYDEDSKGVSGAFYLSSKMIPSEVAEDVFDRNTKFSYETYLLPSTGAVRLANPTLLLFNKQGEIVGRLNARQLSDRTFPVEENIARLDELIGIAKGGRKGEEHKDSSTTTLLLNSDGGKLAMPLSVNDNAWVIAVDDIKVGQVTFSVDIPEGKEVNVELFTSQGAYPDGDVLAEGIGTVTYNFGLEGRENVFVRVSCCNDAGDADYSVHGNSEFEVVLNSTFTAHPGSVAFIADSVTWRELAGKGVFAVKRSGGMSGKAAVRITVDENKTTACGRYEFEPVEVVWEEGEMGIKEFEVSLIADSVIEEPEHLVLKMEPLDGNSAVLVSPDSFTATIFDTDEPVFGSLAYSVEGYKKFAGEELFTIFNVSENGRVSLKKEEGKLPSGVSLKYDAQSGKVVLSGSPSKPGEYTAVYSISQNGKKGPASTITITVKDPAESNPYIGQKISRDVMLYADIDGRSILAGKLEASISSANKIKAKYTGTESKSITFSGQWDSFDWESGVASANIVTRQGAELKLELSKDGTLRVVRLAGVENEYGEEFSGEQVAPQVNFSFDNYAGYYNVALPAILEDGETAESTGTGYLTLTMTSQSYIKTGKMKYSGVLGNGTSISGYAYLVPSEDPDIAYLPVFTRKSKDLFSAVLQLKSGAYTNALSVADLQSIHRAEGVVALHRHIEDGFDYSLECEVYGSYYEKGIKLPELCEVFEINPVGMVLSADMSAVSSAGSNYGTPYFGKEAVLDASQNKFTLLNKGETQVKSVSFSKSTGLFNGSMKITFENGRSSNATFKGILQPGWQEDCGCGEAPDVPMVRRPFASGTLYYTDCITTDVGGLIRTINVKRSVPVMIEAGDMPVGGGIE